METNQREECRKRLGEIDHIWRMINGRMLSGYHKCRDMEVYIEDIRKLKAEISLEER